MGFSNKKNKTKNGIKYMASAMESSSAIPNEISFEETPAPQQEIEAWNPFFPSDNELGYQDHQDENHAGIVDEDLARDVAKKATVRRRKSNSGRRRDSMGHSSSSRRRSSSIGASTMDQSSSNNSSRRRSSLGRSSTRRRTVETAAATADFDESHHSNWVRRRRRLSIGASNPSSAELVVEGREGMGNSSSSHSKQSRQRSRRNLSIQKKQRRGRRSSLGAAPSPEEEHKPGQIIPTIEHQRQCRKSFRRLSISSPTKEDSIAMLFANKKETRNSKSCSESDRLGDSHTTFLVDIDWD